MTFPANLTELEDRWVVNARHDPVKDLRASPNALRIELESGLWIDVTGVWRATVGSPVTGEELDSDALGGILGSEVLSLVLFATGAIRIVLSTGATVVAKAKDTTRVTVGFPDSFTWAADAQSVTHSFGEHGGDG